MVWKII